MPLLSEVQTDPAAPRGAHGLAGRPAAGGPTTPGSAATRARAGAGAARAAGGAQKERPLTLSLAEKRAVEAQANLVAIIKTVEHLEKGFVGGWIGNDVYESHVSKLISQFRVQRNALRSKYPDPPRDGRGRLVNPKAKSGMEVFWDEHINSAFGATVAGTEVGCPLAKNRLLDTGMAATLLHGSGGGSADGGGGAGGGVGGGSTLSGDAVHIFDAGQQMTTLADSLDMSMRSVDDLLPLMKDLYFNLSKITSLPGNSGDTGQDAAASSPFPDVVDGKEKLRSWLSTLNQMGADESLTDSQSRQFKLDLSSFYAAFQKWLQSLR